MPVAVRIVIVLLLLLLLYFYDNNILQRLSTLSRILLRAYKTIRNITIDANWLNCALDLTNFDKVPVMFREINLLSIVLCKRKRRVASRASI